MAQTNTKTVRRKRKVRLLTRNGQYYDYNLLACVVLLTCFGLIMLYSTSAYDAQVEYGSDTYFLFRQALFSVGGLAAIFIFSMIDYHFYARYAGYFYLFSNLLLLVTKFIGHEVNGAKRWIKIGPIQFQSAEPAKLAIILFLSVLIVQFGKKLKGFKAPAVLFAFGALTFLLTWKFTENLSTAIIILGITCALIFVAHPKTAPFVLTAGIGLPVGIVGVRGYVSSLGASGNFRFNRVLAWIDPEKYSDGGGYQVLQGLYAIGSGGLFGKGLGNSTQKIQSIPEAQNDMIFSIICEELGLFGDHPVCFSAVPTDVYRTECTGSARFSDRYRYFCTYRFAGHSEYCRCIERDSYNRCYAPIYQLRRYFDSLPDDGNGNRPECLAADPDKRQLMIISAKGGS